MRESDCNDITIMFMTDGKAKKETAIEGLNFLINSAKNLWKDVWMLCLGFSAGHEAQLLGQIAREGTDLGNFVYIDD